MMRLLRNLKNKTFDRIFPGLAYKHKKSRWQASWTQSEFAPDWKVSEIPDEIQDSVDNGWFHRGASILDIGCGSGEIAAWLAKKNYKVLGVDYAEAAIKLAQTQFGNIGANLAFQTVDICGASTGLLQYEGLIDRGCLHGIPEAYVSVYASNIAACAAPGAHFLLLYATNKGQRKTPEEEDQLRGVGAKFVQKLFMETFEIISIEPTFLVRGDADPASGIVVKMLRKGC